MPLGRPLSEFEKGQITEKKRDGTSNRQIAIELGRSRSVINNFVNDPDGYGTKPHSGRPPLISDRDKRQILREASNSSKSCAEIKSDLNLNVTREAVRLVLKKSKFILYRKMRKAPSMTAWHREKRLEFAKKWYNTNWDKVRFNFSA